MQKMTDEEFKVKAKSYVLQNLDQMIDDVVEKGGFRLNRLKSKLALIEKVQ